jgi:hypothetical protein
MLEIEEESYSWVAPLSHLVSLVEAKFNVWRSLALTSME